MAEYEILALDKLSDTRAEEISLAKEYDLVKEIARKIKRTMKKKNLTSLSAPAIGYNKRIFCIDFSDNEIKTFINPLILESEGMELTREICSSIPDKEFIRPRNTVIDVIYQRLDGTVRQNRFTGLAATVFQHEVDHLDGITLADIGLEIEEDFDKASEKDKYEIIDLYLKSLNIKRENIMDEINKDDVTKIIYNNEKLAELVGQGKIEVVNDEDEVNA